MKTLSSALAAAACFAFTFTTVSAQPLAAQTTALQPRITAPIDNADRVTLTGSRPPLARPADDIGAVAPSMKLSGISLVFSRSAAQQADLDALVLAQQQPSSPLYHQWLTPDQFAARFGVADADIAAVENWLQLQGFSIDSVSRSRNRIFFSGTAALVSSAFGAPIHYFKSTAPNGVATTHFAPANDLTVPAALGSSVLAIEHLSSFRPHTHVVQNPVRPRYTVQGTQAYFLTPPDVATIYDIKPAYSQGFTGTGQTIAIIGQSAIVSSDITTFQTLLGQTAKAPGTFLVPGTGTSAISLGDEGESDIDLEYSSATAPGATIDLYYTGNNPNYGAFDALEYLVDNAKATVISSSYGDCEFDEGSTNIAILDAILEQAVVQGETFISASGDTGSTDCAEDTNLTFAQQTALAVDYPASSVYALAAGGTEFPAADVTPTNTTYWTSDPGSSDVISTALSYIPEQAWNDDAVLEQAILAGQIPASDSPLSSGGGGVSLYEPLPSWQTGVAGIPSGANRFVPDLSLAASPNYPGYLFCSSDTSGYSTGQTGSCTDGFSNIGGQYLYYTAAGGTSFVAPILAGLVAVINQAKGYTTGQGLINPTLYKLAASNSTYAAAFHDITSGSNACQAGSVYCSTGVQTTDFVTTTGYDEATGLGSLDFNNLLTAWPTAGGGSSTTASSTTTVTAATTTPAIGVSDTITITVATASTTVTAVPTGTVSISVNGTVVDSSLALINGSVTYPITEATAGSYIVSVTYSGDTNYSSSLGNIVLNVTPPGAFVLSATNVTVASGSSANSTVTATPSGGYIGTVQLSLALPANSTLTNVCVTDTNNGVISITGTSAGTDVITVYTSATTCNNLGLSTLTSPGKSGTRILPIGRRRASVKLSSSAPHPSPWRKAPLPAALAGMLLLFGLRRRGNRNLLRIGLSLLVVAMLSLSGLGLTACSNNSTSTVTTTPGDTPAGTYSVQIIGTDSVSSALTSTANVTLTVN